MPSVSPSGHTKKHRDMKTNSIITLAAIAVIPVVPVSCTHSTDVTPGITAPAAAPYMQLKLSASTKDVPVKPRLISWIEKGVADANAKPGADNTSRSPRPFVARIFSGTDTYYWEGTALRKVGWPAYFENTGIEELAAAKYPKLYDYMHHGLKEGTSADTIAKQAAALIKDLQRKH